MIRWFHILFMTFNQKYDDKFNNVLNQIDLKSSNEIDRLTPFESELIIDYLNFCAEEYLWYKKGRIPESVWKAWEAGMIYYLNIGLINEKILQEKSQEVSYYGLFKKIGKQISNWN